jgi:hypothetical protein
MLFEDNLPIKSNEQTDQIAAYKKDKRFKIDSAVIRTSVSEGCIK